MKITSARLMVSSTLNSIAHTKRTNSMRKLCEQETSEYETLLQ